MMARASELADFWLGLCRKAPVFRTAPVELVSESGTSPAMQPAGSGPAPAPGSMGDGIRIATGSIRALFRERSLWWFVLLSGLIMLALLAKEWWDLPHMACGPSFSVAVPLETKLLVNAFMVFDVSILLLEMVCLSCFTLVLAGLVLHRYNRGLSPATIRESFTGINGHAGSLLALSLFLAVIAWLLFEVISQFRLFGGIVSAVSRAVFHLPYATYFPDDFSAALFFWFLLMFINLAVLVIALQIIPGIVLGNKRFFPAIASALSLLKRNWREFTGCAVVFGLIVLAATAVALIIGQSPLILGHDYDFFLQISRGQVLMTAVCYGFIIACWALMAAWLTAAGVAAADLCRDAECENDPGGQ